MKRKFFTATFLTLLFIGASLAQNSSQIPADFKPVLTKSEFFGENRKGGCNVLVLRDQLPWSIDATVPLLISQGATVTTATSLDFPSFDFSVFDVIVIESAQNDPFYEAYSTNFSKFVNFVQNGGTLQIHTAKFCDPQCVAPNLLPGGITSVSNLEFYNNVLLPTHPIVAGVPDPFYGFSASHGHFTNLIPGTLIITKEQNNSQPTTIEYAFGDGLVIATSVTVEAAYVWPGFDAKEMLPNMLQYSCTVLTPSIPLSNWALYLGIFLIVMFTAIRFRKMV